MSESVSHTTALDLFFTIAAAAVINAPSASSRANREAAPRMPGVASQPRRRRDRGFKLDTDPKTEPRPDATREDGVPTPLRERESRSPQFFWSGSDSASPAASGPRQVPGPRPAAHADCVGVVACRARDLAAPPELIRVDRVHGYEWQNFPEADAPKVRHRGALMVTPRLILRCLRAVVTRLVYVHVCVESCAGSFAWRPAATIFPGLPDMCVARSQSHR